MKHFAGIFLVLSSFFLPVNHLAAQIRSSPPPNSGQTSSITVPQGTKVELVVTRPVQAMSAKAGDAVYAQTSFPTVAGNGMAIPAGTYVQGNIANVTKPTRRTNRAELDVLFTEIIFADGYIVQLPGRASATQGTNSASANSQSADGETLIAVTIQATTANDLLLDNGAEVEMTLGAPLVLDAKRIAQSIPLSHAPQPAQFKSATVCRAVAGTPGTPGSPDTVIPGSPGTPSTTIPGGPGMPDTVIPGTPATPDTVIPGTPGSPGFPGSVCPPRPLVISCAPVVTNKPTQDSSPVATR